LRNETHRAPFANDAFRSSTHPIYFRVCLKQYMQLLANKNKINYLIQTFILKNKLRNFSKIMMKKPLIIFFTTFFLMSAASHAVEQVYKPFVKGSFEQIQQQNKDTPYIVAFWSVTCAYCMKELEMFGELMPKYPAVKLITISTDPFLENYIIQRLLTTKKLEQAETWVFADNFSERLYFDINPRWRGELPLTYFFDKNNKRVKHMGIVNKDELVEWLAEQTKQE